MTVDPETRFEFGENWRGFIDHLTPERMAEAERSLAAMLGRDSLAGKTFLDVGCGSGLFSLAARRLKAVVLSFDFDPVSVGCASALKEVHFPGDPSWQVQHGSALDAEFMARLGRFDIVYSWGVLHHTGNMWQALDQACQRVRPDGQLFIAIYNDQGARSRWWRTVKHTYNRLPRRIRPLYLGVFATAMELTAVGVYLIRGEPRRLMDRWTKYHGVRGMSRWHDMVDWIGGFPFEVATPEKVLEFCRVRSFSLERLTTCGGRMGCNEFVLARAPGHGE